MKPIINHTTFSKYDKVQLVMFYPLVNMITFNNYTSESFALSMRDKYTIGQWKIKNLK